MDPENTDSGVRHVGGGAQGEDTSGGGNTIKIMDSENNDSAEGLDTTARDRVVEWG